MDAKRYIFKGQTGLSWELRVVTAVDDEVLIVCKGAAPKGRLMGIEKAEEILALGSWDHDHGVADEDLDREAFQAAILKKYLGGAVEGMTLTDDKDIGVPRMKKQTGELVLAASMILAESLVVVSKVVPLHCFAPSQLLHAELL